VSRIPSLVYIKEDCSPEVADAVDVLRMEIMTREWKKEGRF